MGNSVMGGESSVMGDYSYVVTHDSSLTTHHAFTLPPRRRRGDREQVQLLPRRRDARAEVERVEAEQVWRVVRGHDERQRTLYRHAQRHEVGEPDLPPRSDAQHA